MGNALNSLLYCSRPPYPFIRNPLIVSFHHSLRDNLPPPHPPNLQPYKPTHNARHSQHVTVNKVLFFLTGPVAMSSRYPSAFGLLSPHVELGPPWPPSSQRIRSLPLSRLWTSSLGGGREEGGAAESVMDNWEGENEEWRGRKEWWELIEMELLNQDCIVLLPPPLLSSSIYFS